MSIRDFKHIFIFTVLFIVNFFSVQSQTTTQFIKRIQDTGDSFELNLGHTIYEGVFTGNGLLGTMTFLKDSSQVEVRIGRTDVYDHRSGGSNLWQRPRLPLGAFIFKLSDKIIESTGKIDLYNAESTAKIKTRKGDLTVNAISLAEENYILLSIDESAYKGDYRFKWHPQKSQSPRAFFDYVELPKGGVKPNPHPIWHTIKKGQVCVQPMLAGGGYGVGYKKFKKGAKTHLLIATDYRQKNTDIAATIQGQLQNFKMDKRAQKIKKHQKWWHAYYRKSAINIPDKQLQDFYNFQLYKLASATRSDKPAIDLQGPWTAKTPWPGYWFNLNLQLTYSPLYTANHLELAESLLHLIDDHTDQLSQNVPKPYQYDAMAIGRSAAPDLNRPVKLEKGKPQNLANPDAELGNLTWLLHSYYRHYAVTQDKAIGNKVFNLLKKSINYYLYLLEKNDQDKYHIAVKTYSPEYSKGYAYDTNYDLSILRWGLSTLIELDNKLNKNDKLRAKWEEVLNNLIGYPVDKTGFMIAKNVPYEESHRHYSHLMMIYPFYEINWDQKENRKLIKKSIETWQSKPAALQGYSLTGLASMKAMMGKGTEASKVLKKFIKKFVTPNTLYAESGPVIETPLSAMTSIEELYVQYWNDIARAFPAIPEHWENVSFENLRIPGAFLLSGKRKDGKNDQLKIYSKKGGILRIKPNLEEPIRVSGEGKILNSKEGVYTVTVPKEKTLILSSH